MANVSAIIPTGELLADLNLILTTQSDYLRLKNASGYSLQENLPTADFKSNWELKASKFPESNPSYYVALKLADTSILRENFTLLV